MTIRMVPLVCSVLVAVSAVTARAAEPCRTAGGRTVPVEIRFDADKDAIVAGVTVLVAYPATKVDVPGKGRNLPKGTIDGTPAGALVAPDDRDGEIRIAIGSPQPIPHGALVTLHMALCEGAAAPNAEDFTCTVQEAVDVAPNPITGVTCSVVTK